MLRRVPARPEWIEHSQEVYFSQKTLTLSDYPLLVGEIIRRFNERHIKRCRRRALLYKLGRALGIQVYISLGKPIRIPYVVIKARAED
jgi:hypothetical protein